MKLEGSIFPNIAISLIAVITLSGCASTLKTPAEFRAYMKEGGTFRSSETYMVKRPYQQVVNTYKQRAPVCFNQTIESVFEDRYGKHRSSSTWTAKLSASDKHMECTLQWRSNDANVVDVNEPPNKYGHYFFLVDAYPVDQNTTRLVISGYTTNPATIAVAAKNWATGENQGCPDMTQ